MHEYPNRVRHHLTKPWHGDLLNYHKTGETFTNLIQTLDETKVISIEAGFGRGKTFFRTEWAKQLRGAGEVVIEIDAQQSDHSGDPMITFLAALVEALPRDETGKAAQVYEKVKKFGKIGGYAAARMVFRSSVDEAIDAVTDKTIDELGDFDALDGVVNDLGEGMSKAAGQMIATQMAAERVRKKELPEQLTALHAALTEGAETERVVVIVDELDRCHPAYAIAVLEAMKLVFAQSGFVFCLMVNAEYLEKLAQHQFGVSTDDEKYLDKFVDIRLRLQPSDESIKSAVRSLALDLPLAIPFGDDNSFSVEATADLAGKLAVKTKLSMRKVKRILLQVELALRCYSNQPIDAPLLVFLAFESALPKRLNSNYLLRSQLRPDFGVEQIRKREEAIKEQMFVSGLQPFKGMQELKNFAPELIGLPIERYQIPAAMQNEQVYQDWKLVYRFLAPHYIPTHQDMLGSVAEILAD